MKVIAFIFCLFVSVNALGQSKADVQQNTPFKIIASKVDINKALFFVDDSLYTGKLQDIDTAAIESFDISTDTAMLKIYGTKAKYGVVYIHLKQKPPANIPLGTIRIRCMPSLTKGQDPLFIVDDKIYKDPLEVLNPNDILSVNILKGKEATDKYGAAGKYGVVIVKTKPKTKTDIIIKKDN